MAIFGLYLLVAVIAYWRLLPHLATWQAQSGNGDPASADWYLAWDRWSVIHLHDPFVTRVVNYPDGANMVSNTAMLALGVLMIPVTSVWGPVASFNILDILSMPLSAGGGYLLARRFTAWRPAAFCAGLLYGFCPFLVAHDTGHLNLVFVPLPPLIMLLLYDLLVEPRGSPVRRGGLLGVALSVQFLISSEVFATTLLFSLLALVLIVLCDRDRVGHARARLGAAGPGLALAGAIVAVVLAWPVYENLFGLQHVDGAPDDWFFFHSSLLAPLLPTRQFILGTAHLKQLGTSSTPSGGADGPYLGLPLIVTLLVGAVLIRRRAARLLGLLVAIVFVLSMGDRFSLGLHRYAGFGRHWPLPGALLHDTPLLKSAYPGRFSLFVALFAALLLGLAVDGLRRRPWPRRAGPAAALGVAVVCLLPLVPRLPFTDIGPVAVPAYFTGGGVNAVPAGSVALVYPYDDQGLEAYAELWQAEAGFRFRMVDGSFLLPSPAGITYARPSLTQRTMDALMSGHPPALTPELRAGLQGELASWRVGTVLVKPLAGAQAFFEWLVGRPADDHAGGVLEWYHVTWDRSPPAGGPGPLSAGPG